MRRFFTDIFQAGCQAITGLISKAGSRKFILMMIATHAMYSGILPPEYWTAVALAWKAAQGGEDMISTYKLPPTSPESPNGPSHYPQPNSLRDIAM